MACRIIVPSPGPGLCHSQRFFERFFGDSLRDSYGMDLDRSLTILGYSEAGKTRPMLYYYRKLTSDILFLNLIIKVDLAFLVHFGGF